MTKQLLYHRYRLTRPADGAVFLYDSYLSSGVRGVVGIFTEYQQYALTPVSGQLYLKRTYWELDSRYNYGHDSAHYFYRRRLQELKERQGQLLEVYWKTVWRRLITITTVDAEYIGVVEG